MKYSPAFFARTLAGLGLLFVAGCGTGGGLSTVSGPSGSGAGRGGVKVTIHWPARSRSSRLIPVAAESIRLTLTASGAKTPAADKPVSRPTTGDSTTIVIPDLLPDTYTETATAYPKPDATGTAQAVASQTIVVAAETTVSTPDLVMQSTIKTVVIAPAATTTTVGAAAVKLTATAKDAAGNAVMTAPSSFSWSNDKPALARLTPTGSTASVASLAAGTVNITVEEIESKVTSNSATIFIGMGTGGDPSKIFVVDAENNRLVGLDAIPATSFLTLPGLDAQVATDSKGNIYSLNGNSAIVQIVNINGDNRQTYTVHGSGTSVIGVDHKGQIYFYDDSMALNRIDNIGGGNLQTYNPTNQFGGHLLNGTNAIAFDSQNRIYLIQQFGGVTRFDDITGKNPVSFGTTGSGVGQFKFPHDLAIDAQNRIYVADAGNHRIVRFDDMTGKNFTPFPIPSEVGSQNTASDAVAVDRSTTVPPPPPHIYFSDAAKGILYKMDDMTGKNLVQYGTKGSGNGQFNFPISIAVK